MWKPDIAAYICDISKFSGKSEFGLAKDRSLKWSVLQKDLVDVLQKAAQDGMQGVIISVSKVSVTPDLGVAKVYLSVFPSDKRNTIIEGVKHNSPLIQNSLLNWAVFCIFKQDHKQMNTTEVLVILCQFYS